MPDGGCWLGLLESIPERCPECGGPPVCRRGGLVAEYRCGAGHVWHRCGRCRRAIATESDPTRALCDHLCVICRKVRG